MAGEVFAGLSAFKTLLDLAKGLKDIDDAVRRNAAVMELQEKILEAQSAQSTLVERNSELEKEVADLKAWGAEKQNYELKGIEGRSFVYVKKPTVQSSEPAHWLCATCYQHNQKSFMQFFAEERREHIYKCPQCEAILRVNWNITPEKLVKESQPAIPPEQCPKCGESEFRIERSGPHPTFGVVGMKCDKCGFTEDRLVHPK